jgi:hypothetical protein
MPIEMKDLQIKRTKLIGVLSWVLPMCLIFLSQSFIIVIDSLHIDIRTSVKVALFVVSVLIIVGGLILGLHARSRSKRLHDGKYNGHSSLGIIFNICVTISIFLNAVYFLLTRESSA